MKSITRSLILVVSIAGFSRLAGANEFTDVIDAFDKDNGDPFDLNIEIGYARESKSMTIRRESTDRQPHTWDYYAYRNMFDYKQITHILNMSLEIGLFRDLSLKVRLPLILNDTREVRASKDWTAGFWGDNDKDGKWNQAGDALFNLPLISPERSGLDYIAAGLWWGVLDQGREETQPNWTIFVEGRFGIGDELQAACQQSGNDSCSNQAGMETKSGVSRGLNELAAGFRLSRRFGIFDPFFGFDAIIGWAKDGTGFFIPENAAGTINDMPPIRGTLDFGLEIIPWEIPERELKFVIGIGGFGTYHSEGRDYTPLFDALGTSAYFRDQTYVDFNGNGINDSINPDTDSDRAEKDALANWTGMTDVENYATFGGRLFLMIQPAKYVKFKVGFDMAHETEHFITKTDQCTIGNLIANPDPNEPGTVCTAPNFGHRPELDSVGNRFRAEDSLLWTFFIDATAMF